MSDLLSRLESRIRQAVEKIEEYQLEIDELKERNTVLEAERQEMHDKLALLIDSFEELEAAVDESESATEVTEEVAETVLAHKVGNKVIRAYRRTDHFTERAALMERWAQHVTGAKNVIELRK